jgi:putative polyhydroxyalkanoate system protein
MATIRIHRPHAHSPLALRRQAEAVARRLEARHAVRWTFDDNRLGLVAASGVASGARGTVTIGDRDVTVELTLPFGLRPMRALVERELGKRLDALLANVASAAAA